VLAAEGDERMQIAVAGATGRTGRQIIVQALRRGHSIKALTRREPPPSTAGEVAWISGDTTIADSLFEFLEGADAVISAVGPRSARSSDTCTTATRNLLNAGARRLIVVSGMGVTLPEDRKGAMDRIVASVVRLLSPNVFEDKVRELDLLRSSEAEWTAIRVGALMAGDDPKPVKADAFKPAGFRIDVGSLAAFCVEEAESRRFVRQAPFVSL